MSGCDSLRHDPWSFDTDNRWRVYYAGYYKVQLLHSALVAHWRWLILSLTPACFSDGKVSLFIFKSRLIDLFVSINIKRPDAFKNKLFEAPERIISMTAWKGTGIAFLVLVNKCCERCNDNTVNLTNELHDLLLVRLWRSCNKVQVLWSTSAAHKSKCRHNFTGLLAIETVDVINYMNTGSLDSYIILFIFNEMRV